MPHKLLYCFLLVATVATTLAIAAADAADTSVQPTAKTLFIAAFELYKSGQFESAINAFERGLVQSPRNGKAHYYLAECLTHLGKIDEALVHYERTVEYDPASKEGVLAAAKLPLLRDPASRNADATSAMNSMYQRIGSAWKVAIVNGSVMKSYKSQCSVSEESGAFRSLNWSAANIVSDHEIFVPCKEGNVACVHRTERPLRDAANQPICSYTYSNHDYDGMQFFATPGETDALFKLLQSFR